MSDLSWYARKGHPLSRCLFALAWGVFWVGALGLTVTVQAAPSPPHIFWGTVMVGGATVPAGTLVTAYVMDGAEVVVCGTARTVILDPPSPQDSVYGIAVNGDDGELAGKDGAYDGDTVYFLIGEGALQWLAAQTAFWHSSQTTELNLTDGTPVTPTATATQTSTTPTTTPTDTATPTPTATQPTPTSTATSSQPVIVVSLQQGADGYAGVVDTWISTWDGTANYEGQPTMTFRGGDRDRMSLLLRFDLSAIPSNAFITAASLELYALDVTNPAGTWAGSFAVRREWASGQVTWMQAESGVAWGDGGCNLPPSDRDAVPSDTVMVEGEEKWFSWNVTSMAQQWIAGLQSNHGLIIRCPWEPVSANVEHLFQTSEGAVVEHRPKLVIAYQLPDQPTPTPTATQTSSATASPTSTSTATGTATHTVTATQTMTPSATSTGTQPATPTPTQTEFPAPTPSQTVVSTETPTMTLTSTIGPSPTSTVSPSETATSLPANTSTITPTRTPTRTSWPTWTPTPTPIPGPVHASTEWVNFYGQVSLDDGSPAPPGTSVDAFDALGVHCGTYYVTTAGRYGMMPVYRDDPTTPARDGVQPGDLLRFTVGGLPAAPLGPQQAVWTSHSDVRHVDLVVAPIGQRTLFLPGGWNLVSFDLLPLDASVSAALSSIVGKYEHVLGFDCGSGAQSYYPDLPPALNTLRTMDPWHGYWIKMKEDAHLELVGLQVPDQTPMSLCAGYNLLGYLPDQPLPVATALVSLQGHLQTVMGFDPFLGGQSYYPQIPPALNTLRVMEPGRGFWVRLLEPRTLSYP